MFYDPRGPEKTPSSPACQHAKCILVDGVTAFVSNVEFEDGNWWIPSRNDISNSALDASLKRTLVTSPEQQRLAEIYRRRGLTALTTELKKFVK